MIVSLRQMNRVLEIDPDLAYAVVEPGVRWFDLYEAIRTAGHPLMLSIADLGWGSVVGNTLDHGVTYLPYGVDMGMQCGMEVVLADGSVMRTGMGAMPGNRSWHLYKRGLGPTPDQLFMQSNFGIVTKMGVWLMPMPETYMPLWLRVWSDDDLAPMFETLRVLMLDGTIRMVPQVMNTVLYGAVVARRADFWTGEGPIPDEVLDRMGRELDIGRWLMRFALYEDEAVADHKFAKIKRAFEAAIPGADVWGTKYTPEEIPGIENPAEKIQGGIPNLDWNAMTAWYGGEEGGHIGFSPVAPLTGPDALALRDLLRGMVEGAGLDYIAGLLPINARSFIHITMVIFDTKDEAQSRAAYDVSRRLVVEAAKLGYGEYRAHLDFMDLGAGAVLLRRSRLSALLRDAQGRPGPQRDPLARQAGHLACVDARPLADAAAVDLHESLGLVAGGELQAVLGHPHRRQPVLEVLGVALAVVPECVLVVVELPAVQLDDEVGLRKEHVDLPAMEPDVGLWGGEAVLLHEGQEVVLER